MYDASKDRSYWRGAGDRQLIEAARDSGHELAIALGERLEEATGETGSTFHLKQECEELEKTCDLLRQRIKTLEGRLATAEQGTPDEQESPRA